MDAFAKETSFEPIMATDLFGTYIKDRSFFWSVAIFSGNGAAETIRNAMNASLKTFYPFYKNKNGKYFPLWKSYLFIEYVSPKTTNVCRQSTKFLGFISFDNSPELVAKNAIDECIAKISKGNYDFNRRTHGFIPKGSEMILKCAENEFFDNKLVITEDDIFPTYPPSKKISIRWGHLKIRVEIEKLSKISI